MKPFRFSLQSLRVLREQKERVTQKRYVEALRASDAAAAKLDAGTHELSAAWVELCEEVVHGITVAKLCQTRAWCGTLERRCAELATALKSAQQAAQEAWREMALATRDRKVLDQLRDKSRRAYDREAQRDEQKQLDEMGINLRFAMDDLPAAGPFASQLQIANHQS
jgi:flagellar export protein FliJ